MVRPDALIFGYRVISVAKEDVGHLANILLKLGINADISQSGEIVLRERDLIAFTSAARGRLRFTVSELYGFPGAIRRCKRRYGVIFGVVAVLILNILLSLLVWDIRIEGNERMSDREILELLCESGFEVGGLWMQADKNKIESDMLSKCPDIAWLSINRRGTVAYVEVSESENIHTEQNEELRYCNVVADRDAVIEEITVKKGTAAVKAGDVVRKGDVLISGVVENERGVVFCHAEGSVRGVSLERLSCEIERVGTVVTKEKPVLCQIKINIFKFSINIFKNYRNHKEGCGIIKNEKKYSLSGERSLPFSVTRIYAEHYTENTVTRTDAQMTELALSELRSITEKFLLDAELIKLKTYGEFGENGYILTSEVVYALDIGEESVIETG